MSFLDIYQRVPGLVLGFHGCDRAVGEAVLTHGGAHLKSSANDYDWLGGGIYFWENDPQRALEFAIHVHDNPMVSKGVIKDPFVVGAVIDLGLCCNLLDRTALAEIATSYAVLASTMASAGKELPSNGKGRRLRMLDCLVIENMHKLRTKEGVADYDTVRGAIWEGDPLYPGAAIEELNHVQIAVRKPELCIKGYFHPRKA